MFKKHISILIALVAAAAVASCGAYEALAEESANPPQEVPPPAGGATPSSGEEIHPPVGEAHPPEMMGRPMERGGGSSDAQYNREYQGQYGEEVQRQTGQKTREMRERYTPHEGGSASGGQPYIREPMRQQGRPMGGGMQRGPQDGFGEQGMNNRGGFGQEGGFGGRDMGDHGGTMGKDGGMDSEEMEKKMQEREKQMGAQQLKQMKRGMVSGIEQGLKQIKKMTDKLSKKGIAIPADAQSLVTELTGALEKVKAATELTDDVEAAMEVIQDKGQDLGEVGQKLGILEQFSQTTKQVEKEFTRIDKEVVKAKKSKAASQYPDVVAKIDGQVSALKQKWESTKQGILSGEADEDMRDMMDEIFEGVGEVRYSISVLQQLSSISKMIVSAGKEIARFEKEIARQKKAGKDVSKLELLLAEAKAKLGEIQSLSKQSTFDPEDLFDRMQELEHIRNQAVDELNQMTGKTEAGKLQSAVIQSLELRRLGF